MVDRNIVCPLILMFALGLAGCDGSSDAVKPATESADRSVDTGAELARASLLASDLAFGNAVVDRGLAEAYRQFLAEDAVQLPDGDRPLRGRTIIFEQIQDATGDSDFLLSWKPEAAEVAVSGDLGYTWGTYWLELLDDAGEPVVIEGNYVNVWRKSTDNVWEVVVDISNQITADYVANALIDENEQVATPVVE